MQTELTLSLADLCDTADVTPRTVRYYVAQGLLPSPSGSGPAARYSQNHLARLRLIKRLQREHLPLAEIRGRLSALSDDQVRGLASLAGGEPTPSEGEAAGSALDYIRGILGGVPDPARPAPAWFALPVQAPLPVASPAPRPVGSVRREDEDIDVASEAPPSPSPASRPPAERVPSSPPPSPDRSQWDRVALTPDIELHVRRPLGRLQNRRVERLVAIARELLEED
ncbi:MAG TPA: MerR family transcriptional regulator [Candidatus Limnocylindrales bacterium]